MWRAPEDDRLGWARAALAVAVAALLVPVLVGGFLWAQLLHLPLSGPMPPVRPVLESGITRVYDPDGVELAAFRRFETNLPSSRADIPEVLKQAVVAVEDRRFYSHRGVDGRGLLRAGRRDTAAAAYVEGASTITQQLVRLAYTDDRRRTLGRKVREAVLARRLETQLSKDEILHRYLSRVYLGGGAYGVAAASQSYFRKPVKDLTLSEAALLAGVIPAPSRYDPRVDPGAAEAQRRMVLGRMLSEGHISRGRHDAAVAEPVVLADESGPPPAGITAVYQVPPESTRHPFFVDYVRRYLIARYGEEKVYRGGLRVEASIDPRLQAHAEATVAGTLTGTSPAIEMSLVSLEPDTGLVRALVGGRSFDKLQVNLALGDCTGVKPAGRDEPVCVAGGGGGRQPGSAFKPLTLARALEAGRKVEDSYPGPGTYRYPRCTGPGCTVKNVESGGYGRLNLRQATVNSVNTVFAQLVQDVGVKETAALAHRLGLTMVDPDGRLRSGEPYGPSLTLGAAEVSPLDMAAAYGVFASRGQQFPATPVARVLDAAGNVLEDNTARQGRRVIGTDVADEVNDVLSGVVRKGTGKAADFGRDGTAGKTGTSEQFSDAWFVGYTRSLSTAVWMGHVDSRRPLVDVKGVKVVYGGTLPAAAWKSFMEKALADVPPEPFVKPFRPVYVPPPVVPAPVAPELFEAPVPVEEDPPLLEPPALPPAPVASGVQLEAFSGQDPPPDQPVPTGPAVPPEPAG